MNSPPWIWDELLLACALVVRNDWRELRENDREVRELSDLLRSLPLHDATARNFEKFRSRGSVSRKTSDLASNHPTYQGKATRCSKLDTVVISAFTEHPAAMLEAADAIMAGVGSGELYRIPQQPDEAEEDGTTCREGRLLTRWTIARERSPRLRQRKIRQAERLGQPLLCEVCEFCFDFYGALGKGYIEVHHVTPLHVGGIRETQLDDLAFLCANCHRMCHRNRLGESWRTPAALRTEITNANRS